MIAVFFGMMIVGSGIFVAAFARAAGGEPRRHPLQTRPLDDPHIAGLADPSNFEAARTYGRCKIEQAAPSAQSPVLKHPPNYAELCRSLGTIVVEQKRKTP